MSYSWKNEVLLITGGSSGLGKALALAVAKLGALPVLVARDKRKLLEVGEAISRDQGKSYTFSFDLNETEKIPELYKEIVREVGRAPGVLVNNVGYQVAGFVQNTPIEVYEKNYRVNVLAPIVLTQCVLPDMITQKRGFIVNIMSSVMYHSFPGVSSYCSSKAALGAIHESLKAELAGLPVRTLYVAPCGFQSDYWKNTDFGDRLANFKFKPSTSCDPSNVASSILKAMEQGKGKVELGSLTDKLAAHLNYWFPKLVDKIIVNRNSELLKNRP